MIGKLYFYVWRLIVKAIIFDFYDFPQKDRKSTFTMFEKIIRFERVNVPLLSDAVDKL